MHDNMNKIKIEEIEYSILLKINEVFSNSLNDFSTRLDASLKYIDYITLPIIMASIEEKSYNPFSGIIERYVEYIVSQKMETHGFKFLPLGYSSDMCFECENAIVHIDIKTANIENPSDFKDTIPLGFNQTSYRGTLPLGTRGSGFYFSKGIELFKVYPNLPAEYESTNGEKKITVTNALLFIYPDYKDILDDVRKDYEKILSLIDKKLNACIREILSTENQQISNDKIDEILEKKNKNTNIKTRRILSENIVRAYYIHNLKPDIESKFRLTEEEKSKLTEFIERIKTVSNKLREKNIKPIAIVSISIPNGKLSPLYNDEIVSGKSYGKSIRYHYQNGIFKLLSYEKETKSRVVFLSYDPEYETKLKNYFSTIYVFETKQKKV
ncbi:MAG: hypothetical protein QXU48_05995 [Thermoplasmata archaeon]